MSDDAQTVRSADEHAAEPPLMATYRVDQGGPREDRPAPHAGRFRLVFTALGAVAIVAVALAIVFAGRPRDAATAGSWSSWQPQDGGDAAAREIADHFAPLYRISGTDQLAIVTVANLSASAAASSTSATTASSAGTRIAVRPDANTSQVSLLQGHTVAFDLCGIGSNDCSIAVGTPSADRLLLLRREAFELALYTLRYDSSADNVVALLPPGHTLQTSALTAKPPAGATAAPAGAPSHIAVLFERQELKPFLDQPVAQSLPLQLPPTMSQMALWKATSEAALVEQVTARGLFSQKISQAQDGSNLIVLQPLPPQ